MQYLSTHLRPAAVGALAILGACAVAACDPRPSPADDADPPLYEPPPEACAPAAAPGAFAPCNDGQGIFGTWSVDRLGLPAYDYGLDQRFDERAAWHPTGTGERRDHWHAFGNHRVNATFSNDGLVQVLLQDRGPEWLGVRDEEAGAWGGGASFVDDGEEVWSTVHAWLPEGATSSRRFGLHYVETTSTHRDLRIVRRTYAPQGDHAYVLIDVVLENLGDEPRTVAHHEAWDVARRPLEADWTASGEPRAALREVHGRRDARNGLFEERVRWDDRARVLSVHRAHAAGAAPPPPDAPATVDWYPPEPFLAVLSGEPTDTWTTDAGFFGDGDRARPAALVRGEEGEGTSSGDRGDATSGLGQPRALVVRTDVELGPGEASSLRFAYGARPWGHEEPSIDPAHRHRDVDLLAHAAGSARSKLLFFRTDEAPFLHRELAWHAAQLQASVGYRAYWDTRVVPQGSALLYVRGADGAARDLALFTVPLVYTDPGLARDQLRLFMGLQRGSDGGFAHAYEGHGVLGDGGGIHTAPSDLELSFLWALGEYVGATGDHAFLDRRVPFWPRESRPDATTWDHLTAALRHLFDGVGTGPHGLVRLGTGDGGEAVVAEEGARERAFRDGESVPNTQMAIVILPRIADLVEERDPALAAEIRARVDALRGALAAAWSGRFYGRAFLGDGALHRAGEVDLTAQVWALAGDLFASDADRDATLQAVHEELDRPSATGATVTAGGPVRPATSALLTWGYAQTRPDLAWDHLVRSTMVAHARAYPHLWYGIWSGPDATRGPDEARPGEAWATSAAPTAEFPVMNNNQHAGPLLAALRIAGLEASARGVRVSPRVPSRRFDLRTELIDVSQDGDVLEVVYRPLATASRELTIAAPPGEIVASLACDGVAVAGAAGRDAVTVTVDAPLGDAPTCVASLAPAGSVGRWARAEPAEARAPSRGPTRR